MPVVLWVKIRMHAGAALMMVRWKLSLVTKRSPIHLRYWWVHTLLSLFDAECERLVIRRRSKRKLGTRSSPNDDEDDSDFVNCKWMLFELKFFHFWDKGYDLRDVCFAHFWCTMQFVTSWHLFFFFWICIVLLIRFTRFHASFYAVWYNLWTLCIVPVTFEQNTSEFMQFSCILH
jgi:hypothetical protein